MAEKFADTVKNLLKMKPKPHKDGARADEKDQSESGGESSKEHNKC